MMAQGTVGMARPSTMVRLSFLSAGFGIGVWATNLPVLAQRAGLGEAQLGLMLLCFAAGAILAMMRASVLLRRAGAGTVSAVSAGLFGVCMALVGQISGFRSAAGVAFLCGLTFGTLDVAMNKATATLELRKGRPIMASFHALFSAGTLLAAIVYAQFLSFGLSMTTSLGVAGLLIVLTATTAGVLGRGSDWTDPPVASHGTAAPPAPGRRVLILGVMAAVAFMAEGALMDWGPYYMVHMLGTAESTGAYGYACFAGMMTLGRLVGDRAKRMIGAVPLFAASALLVAASLAAIVLMPWVPVAMIAMGCAGLGIANMVPLVFSSAGQIGAADGGRAMSTVIGMGYGAILVAPAGIGLIAQNSSLRISLGLVVLIVAAVTILSRFLLAPDLRKTAR